MEAIPVIYILKFKHINSALGNHCPWGLRQEDGCDFNAIQCYTKRLSQKPPRENFSIERKDEWERKKRSTATKKAT